MQPPSSRPQLLGCPAAPGQVQDPSRAPQRLSAGGGVPRAA